MREGIGQAGRERPDVVAERESTGFERAQAPSRKSKESTTTRSAVDKARQAEARQGRGKTGRGKMGRGKMDKARQEEEARKRIGGREQQRKTGSGVCDSGKRRARLLLPLLLPPTLAMKEKKGGKERKEMKRKNTLWRLVWLEKTLRLHTPGTWRATDRLGDWSSLSLDEEELTALE